MRTGLAILRVQATGLQGSDALTIDGEASVNDLGVLDTSHIVGGIGLRDQSVSPDRA